MKRVCCVFAICGCVSTVERAPEVNKSVRLETASMLREALRVNSEYEENLLRYLNFNRASASDVLTEVWRRSRLRWRPYDAATNRQIASVPVRVMLGDVHRREAMMVLQSVFEMNAVPMELIPSSLGIYVKLMDSGDVRTPRPPAPPAPPPQPRYHRYGRPLSGYRMYDPFGRR